MHLRNRKVISGDLGGLNAMLVNAYEEPEEDCVAMLIMNGSVLKVALCLCAHVQ